MAVSKLLLLPWVCPPHPYLIPCTWSLEITSGTWLSTSQSRHCDSAFKLMRAKQGVRAGTQTVQGGAQLPQYSNWCQKSQIPARRMPGRSYDPAGD